MAAASIAQVHFAVSSDGEPVAVKILRPGIELAIEADIDFFLWIAEWVERTQPPLRRYRPELLIISAGYDGHHTDPLAAHALTTDGYYALTAAVRALAQEVCGGRLLVVLEGGYALDALAHSVENTVLALLGRPVREPEPATPQVHPVATARVDEYLAQVVAVHRQRLQL